MHRLLTRRAAGMTALAAAVGMTAATPAALGQATVKKPRAGVWAGESSDSTQRFAPPISFKVSKNRKRITNVVVSAYPDCDGDIETDGDRLVIEDLKLKGFKMKLRKGKFNGTYAKGRKITIAGDRELEVSLSGKFQRVTASGRTATLAGGDIFLRYPDSEGNSCTWSGFLALTHK